ncbi:hypothetical protein [Desulfoferrobacter suflitae]|nr:hypothetical protein [Desulfoferrobacter suflitae]MCK8600084.1 hypothetical protein [Desulfoferrobacter suflitae]
MKSILQHHLNVLHVYCRLCPFLGCRVARQFSQRWARTVIYRVLYA